MAENIGENNKKNVVIISHSEAHQNIMKIKVESCNAISNEFEADTLIITALSQVTNDVESRHRQWVLGPSEGTERKFLHQGI